MKLRRMLLMIIASAVGLFALFAAFLYFNQAKLVFIPDRSIDITPDQVGLKFEEVYIEVAPGQKIHGWYFGDSSTASAPTVLFCHGNAGNISHRLQTVQFLLSLGVNVLLFDYRGYGRSDGHVSEDNVYADAEAAYRWLREVKKCEAASLFLFGRSLGGPVAIDLAGRVDCAGLVVESSFTSAIDMGKRLYPFMPVRLLARYHFDAATKIGLVNCPILIGHSPDDDIIPYDMGRTLFERAKSQKRFVVLEGTHNALAYLGNIKYINALQNFFDIKESGSSERSAESESGRGQIN